MASRPWRSRSRAGRHARLAAQAKVAQAKAIADAQIEMARGAAESTRLQAEALRANPEVLRQKEIDRWQGFVR